MHQARRFGDLGRVALVARRRALAILMGVPMEDPSAGITIGTGIVSALTGRKVRNDLAMTGEITIMGKVFAVGGVQEKMRAAVDVGLKEVLIPRENQKEAESLPPQILENIKVTPVHSIEEVVAAALLTASE